MGKLDSKIMSHTQEDRSEGIWDVGVTSAYGDMKLGDTQR